jgi:uncharacterized protein YecA (UPF0149 family)
VTAYVAGIDFSGIQQQGQAPAIVMGDQWDASLLKMLEQVSKQMKWAPLPKHLTPEKIFDTPKVAYESNDEVEVFEVKDDEPVGTPFMPELNDTDKPHKIRPNDPCTCGSGKKYKKCCGMK